MQPNPIYTGYSLYALLFCFALLVFFVRSPVVDEWEIPPHLLVLGETLGQGAFGQVRKACLSLPALAMPLLGKQGLGIPIWSHGEKHSTVTAAVKMLRGN
jgi:hypothetical protein